MVDRGGTEAHPAERAGRVVVEVPVADAVVGLGQDEAQRALRVLAGDQGKRVVQGITEPGVDVPASLGVGVVGQVVHQQDQVVGERLLARAVGTVDAADVAGDVVPERGEQLGQRAVQVEAVSAPPVVGDAAARTSVGSMPHGSPRWIQTDS